MGKNGSRQVLVNSRGKEVEELDEKPAVPGKQLKLTVDIDLADCRGTGSGRQERGDCGDGSRRNGEILAMVSRPTYDPNDFAVRISR